MEQSSTTGQARPDGELAILEALIDAVRGVAPSLRCSRRKRWAVFSDQTPLLVIIAHERGAQLDFDEHVVCAVGDHPVWSSGAVITDISAETLSTLRGLVRKLQLASIERVARAPHHSRRRISHW